MPDWLGAAAARAPERLAVAAEDARWAFAELDREASRLAGALAARGVRQGDVVASLLPASAGAIALIHATWRVGAAIAPIDPRLPASESADRCALVKARWVVADDAATAPQGLPVVSLAALRASEGPSLAESAGLALAALVFTSGTGGQARAARITAHNLAASAAQSTLNLGVRADDRWLPCVPLFHIGGLAAVARAAIDASGLVLQPRFEAARCLDAIAAERVTLLSVVPTMLRRMLDARAGLAPAPLRAVLLGGDGAPADLLADARARGWPVLPTYGLTEATSQVATPAPGEGPEAGCAGRPLALSRVRIDAAPGDMGEIVVEGPVVFAGYVGDVEATARALRGGALHTGDLGRLDKDGRLWVLGRVDDRITTGGEKVDPEEVEAVLRAHPGVADACVVGLPDAQWGQRVVAAVVPRAAVPPDLAEHCRRALSPYKVPKEFVTVMALPRTSSGKVQRGDLQMLLSQRGYENMREQLVGTENQIEHEEE